MSVLADRASGAGVLDRLQVLRSAPTPLRGAPAATWPPSPRTGVRQLRVAGPGLQPWLQDTTTTRTDPAGSTLATPVLGPRNGVHLRGTSAHTDAGGPMRAYSMDLRERALLDSDAGMKAADVAAKYRVSGSWCPAVCRTRGYCHHPQRHAPRLAQDRHRYHQLHHLPGRSQ